MLTMPMLTELKLSNFRVFDDEVFVRFRPITIFIGRNSSGKSSIVKFLLMLQQSMAYGSPQFLSPEGDRVKLGVFRALKNSLSRKRNLRFELTLRNASAYSHSMILKYLELPDDVEYGRFLYKTQASVSYNRTTTIGRARHSIIDECSGASLMVSNINLLDESSFLDPPQLLFPELDVREGRDNIIINKFMAESHALGMLRYSINSISHLSPVREESQRVILASLPSFSYVGQKGQYTLPHLQNMVRERRDQYEFILPHLENVADIENVNFKASSGYVSQAIARNHTTGADVLIADFGFGVSQCLPIFVQGAIMPKYSSLMVEQPEAQLHPTAQLELGSYFADLWNARQVCSIVETHSDNILLRLRRLIAKGELSHKDVSIAFFTVDANRKNMPIIKNLDINEDGSMQHGLPMEFFGADILEGLKLGAHI